MEKTQSYPTLTKSYCNTCEDLVDFDICDEIITDTFKGKQITFNFKMGKCKCCGSEVATDIDYNYRKSKIKWETYEKLSEKKHTNKQYWVSVLIQDTENSKPWLSSMTDSCISLNKAKNIIEKYRTNYRVLSAWIDTFDENNQKSTVLHECYIDTLGNISNSLKVEYIGTKSY